MGLQPYRRGLRDLAARHLKRAVADEDERPPAAGNLHAERGRHGKSHRAVIGRRDALVGSDVDAGEQRVAGVGDERHLVVLSDELVQQVDRVPHLDRFVLLERIEHLGRDVGADRPDRIGCDTGRAGAETKPFDDQLERRVLVVMLPDEDVACDGRDEIVTASGDPPTRRG